MKDEPTALSWGAGRIRIVPNSAASSMPGWVRDAHQRFSNVLFDSRRPFPCFFAPDAERRGEFAYTWLEAEELQRPDRLHQALAEFLDEQSVRSNRAGLVVMCQLAGRSAEETFWSLLRHLMANDPVPWPQDACRDPDDARWGFHYRGVELFFNAHSAAHQRRRSRNAVVDLMLVVQRSSNFQGIIGLDSPSRVQQEIRRKLAAYDSVPLHPSLDIPAGDPDCRAWKQFWVPDEHGPDDRACPFSASSEDTSR